MQWVLLRVASNLVGLALLVLVWTTATVVLADILLTEFPVPTPTAEPVGITGGPDGNLWFTEFGILANRIGRITTAGAVTEFPLPEVGNPQGLTAAPQSIVTGPDGNLWFTEFGVSKIGRITPTGVVTEFAIPTPAPGPQSIAAGTDGNLWFTESGSGKIGRITPVGKMTEFPLAFGHFPDEVTAGPDGNLWFSEPGTSASQGMIGRITPTGSITEFPVPGPIPGSSGSAQAITAGPDGNVWFTGSDFRGSNVGRVTRTGMITEFSLPSSSTPGDAIVTGPDGSLWVAESTPGTIARITTGGSVTEFPAAVSGRIGHLAVGSDGALWFTDPSGNKIGRLNVAPVADTTSPTTTAVVDPLPNGAGWNAANVSVTLTATDPDGSADVKQVTFSVSGAQPIPSTTAPGDTGAFTITAEGVSTVTFFATDKAGNQEQPKTLIVRIDKTKPTVMYAGDRGTYTVDQTIMINCTATDPPGASGAMGSGIVSTTCESVNAPAYTFSLGQHSLSASATDAAGNVGSHSATFAVAVSYSSLCRLTQQLVANHGMAEGMCTVLDAANLNERLGAQQGKAGEVRAYRSMLAAAAGAGFVTSERASVLTRLVDAL